MSSLCDDPSGQAEMQKCVHALNPIDFLFAVSKMAAPLVVARSRSADDLDDGE
jgi:hypothetical protein